MQTSISPATKACGRIAAEIETRPPAIPFRLYGLRQHLAQYTCLAKSFEPTQSARRCQKITGNDNDCRDRRRTEPKELFRPFFTDRPN
jgi:hypothetical protein